MRTHVTRHQLPVGPYTEAAATIVVSQLLIRLLKPPEQGSDAEFSVSVKNQNL